MCGTARLSSRNNEESQPSSDAVAAKALYSASVEERATACCFLVLHEIGFGPSKTMQALVDVQLSTFPA
jgi:hypothetical protein